MKYKIGYDFECDYKESENVKITDIGGYKIISDLEVGVIIKGTKYVNLFELPLSEVSILPLDEEMQLQILDFPFEVEKHHLIYQVSFNNKAWYFNSKNTAYTLLDIILQAKEHALHQKFIDNHASQEEKEN